MTSAPSPTAVCVAEHVSKSFLMADEEVAAVRDVSLRVEPGELVAIVGPSGSGKSTLLALLAGLEAPSAGDVWLAGERVRDLSDDALALLRRRKVGFVFQSFNLVPVLSLADNVALPLLLDGARDSDCRPRVERALETVGLTHRRNHPPDKLSVGERQRAAIARALITEPAVIFADEPTGSLDQARGEEILSLLRNATSAGRTVIMVTHDPQAAAKASRTLRIVDGQLVS